jgi:hypothetical protein
MTMTCGQAPLPPAGPAYRSHDGAPQLASGDGSRSQAR